MPPGGGRSLLPVLAAHALIGAGVVARVCRVVPRDSLRLQAEEAFADPGWRAALGHVLVTVAMACEGLDAPEVAVVVALTLIRSRP